MSEDVGGDGVNAPPAGGLVERLAPLAARAGITSDELDGIAASWRWRATLGAALAAMGAGAALGIHSAMVSPGEADTDHGFLRLLLLVFMILGGVLGDMYGRRRLLMAALAVVVVGSLMASLGVSQSLATYAFTSAAAMGGAVALPLSLAQVRTSLSTRVLGLGVMVYMVGYSVGLALPSVGRLLGSWLGPAFAFAPLVLAAALGLDAVSSYAPADPPPRTGQGRLFSLLLFLLTALGLALAVQSAIGGGAGSNTLLLVGLGVGAGVAFLWWQTRLPDPVMDVRRFRQLWFSSALLGGALVSFGLGVTWRAVLVLLVLLLGLVDLHTLLILVLAALIGAGAGFVVSSRRSQRANGGRLMAAGIATMGLGMLGVVVVAWLGATILWLAVPIALVAAGLTLASLIRTWVILSGVPEQSSGTGAGLLDFAGYFGGMLAPALMVPALSAVALDRLAEDLAAAGAPSFVVLRATASLQVVASALFEAMKGDYPTELQATVAAAYRSAIVAGLEVVLLTTAAVVLAGALVVWVGWRGRDRPVLTMEIYRGVGRTAGDG